MVLHGHYMILFLVLTSSGYGEFGLDIARLVGSLYGTSFHKLHNDTKMSAASQQMAELHVFKQICGHYLVHLPYRPR